MVAQARKVEHERIRVLRVDLALDALEVDVLYRFNIYATKTSSQAALPSILSITSPVM